MKSRYIVQNKTAANLPKENPLKQHMLMRTINSMQRNVGWLTKHGSTGYGKSSSHKHIKEGHNEMNSNVANIKYSEHFIRVWVTGTKILCTHTKVQLELEQSKAQFPIPQPPPPPPPPTPHPPPPPPPTTKGKLGGKKKKNKFQNPPPPPPPQTK